MDMGYIQTVDNETNTISLISLCIFLILISFEDTIMSFKEAFGVYLFIAFLCMVIILLSSTLFKEVQFILTTQASRMFAATLISKSIIRIIFIVYSIFLAKQIIVERYTLWNIRIWLFAFLFSPLLIDAPFFFLSYFLEAKYFTKVVFRDLMATSFFFTFWQLYFAFTKVNRRTDSPPNNLGSSD
jgi:hypothetical protein